MCFAPENEMLVLLWDAGERIVRVHEAPIMEGGAVVVIWPCGVGGGRVEIQPLAFTAIEVLITISVLMY